ncbi:hypothetical protein [uncultured Dokdonia sp.]|uniref:hypothetical protein n=1 Tax=uncultured Dokdonia sp. TaxID=575653 RepID=UPI002634F410|nr:hypothetical protein [uncultured Dokdonia sp.]
MKIQELKELSTFQSDPFYNEMYTQFLISDEHVPTLIRCGSWLLEFKNYELMNLWKEIYITFQENILRTPSIKTIINFEPFQELDNCHLILSRGFHQAYTTQSYASYLKRRDDCRPNQWIKRDISLLNNALKEQSKFNLESKNQNEVLNGLITKSFIEGNSELKWASINGIPWRLYIPPISAEDIELWKKNSSSI